MLIKSTPISPLCGRWSHKRLNAAMLLLTKYMHTHFYTMFMHEKCKCFKNEKGRAILNLFQCTLKNKTFAHRCMSLQQNIFKKQPQNKSVHVWFVLYMKNKRERKKKLAVCANLWEQNLCNDPCHSQVVYPPPPPTLIWKIISLLHFPPVKFKVQHLSIKLRAVHYGFQPKIDTNELLLQIYD